MFVFGHLGIGEAVAKPFSRGLPRRWILLGTLLPDLVDKPLYYGLSWMTGLRGEEMGLISGTRTFGHTGLFLLTLASIAAWRRSRVLAALALGCATHLLLDNVSDAWMPALREGEASTLYALLFPALGWRFPTVPYRTALAHFSAGIKPGIWIPELLGITVVVWETWKQRHSNEILRALQEHRTRVRQRRAARRS